MSELTIRSENSVLIVILFEICVQMQLSVEDEKALEDWLRASEDRLKHRKQDLLRTLKHSKGEAKDNQRRLNQPNRKVQLMS